MREGRLINKTSQQLLAERASCATTFFQKAKGLLGRLKLSPDEALYIAGCRSIHTFFMMFPIDVLFIDSNNKVLKIYRELKPFRMVWGPLKATGVWEFPAQKLRHTPCEVGDEISFISRQTNCEQ